MAKEKKEEIKATTRPVIPPELADVSEHATALKLPAWEKAALMAACGWTDGKQVSQAEFKKALEAFRKRVQGSGRITL